MIAARSTPCWLTQKSVLTSKSYKNLTYVMLTWQLDKGWLRGSKIKPRHSNPQEHRAQQVCDCWELGNDDWLVGSARGQLSLMLCGEHCQANGHIHHVTTNAMVELGTKSQESEEVSSTFNWRVIVRLIGQAKFGTLHKLCEGRGLSYSQQYSQKLTKDWWVGLP